MKFELLLEVEIDPQGETQESLKRRLNQTVKDAVNNGTLTGDSPATVEHYSVSIRRID